jgi:hypothetical protein
MLYLGAVVVLALGIVIGAVCTKILQRPDQWYEEPAAERISQQPVVYAYPQDDYPYRGDSDQLTVQLQPVLEEETYAFEPDRLTDEQDLQQATDWFAAIADITEEPVTTITRPEKTVSVYATTSWIWGGKSIDQLVDEIEERAYASTH